jgi:transglutaminase-like putative cysteine protease
MQNRLELSPPTVTRPFRGPEDTVREMVRAVLGPRGERSMLVRTMTEQCVHLLQDKDYQSELIAIRNFVATKGRYTNDSLGVEVVKDPQRQVEEILARGVTVGDCDDCATLIATMCRQVGREAEFVTVGFGSPNTYSHVFTRVREPKSKQWIVLDTVAGSDEAKMLRRVTTWRAWRID